MSINMDDDDDDDVGSQGSTVKTLAGLPAGVPEGQVTPRVDKLWMMMMRMMMMIHLVPTDQQLAP